MSTQMSDNRATKRWDWWDDIKAGHRERAKQKQRLMRELSAELADHYDWELDIWDEMFDAWWGWWSDLRDFEVEPGRWVFMGPECGLEPYCDCE